MRDWSEVLLEMRSQERSLMEALLKNNKDKAHEICCKLTDTVQSLEDIVATL